MQRAITDYLPFNVINHCRWANLTTHSKWSEDTQYKCTESKCQLRMYSFGERRMKLLKVLLDAIWWLNRVEFIYAARFLIWNGQVQGIQAVKIQLLRLESNFKKIFFRIICTPSIGSMNALIEIGIKVKSQFNSVRIFGVFFLWHLTTVQARAWGPAVTANVEKFHLVRMQCQRKFTDIANSSISQYVEIWRLPYEVKRISYQSMRVNNKQSVASINVTSITLCLNILMYFCCDFFDAWVARQWVLTVDATQIP